MLRGLFQKKKELELEHYEDEDFELDDEEVFPMDEETMIDEDSMDSNEREENIPSFVVSKKKLKRRIGIILLIVLIFLFASSIDFICVSKWNVGPFFAVRTNVYADGGTKVYYGLFYKVIKYHQEQGRRDTEIGFWSMPYSVVPITTTSLDLAIEMQDDFSRFSTKYKRSFLRVTGEVQKITANKDQITIGYFDSSHKYTLYITCSLADSKKVSTQVKKGQTITILGTVSDFKKTSKENQMQMTDCFLGNPKEVR